MHEPRLGIIAMFEGDIRSITCPIDNVTEFTAVTDVLSNREDDVTADYISTSPTVDGNTIYATIGDGGTIPAGSYRYFMTGTYDSGKKATWWVDIIVLAKNLEQIQLMEEIALDYEPKLGERVMYEGDQFVLDAVFTGINDFTAVTGQLREGDDTSVDASYCSGSADFTDVSLTTPTIGGGGTIPQGEYAYFLTGTWGNGLQKTTYYWHIPCHAKVGSE